MELGDVALEQESHLAVERGVTGLVHSAGVLADALLPNQTQAGLQKVWGPKAAAARAMHRAGCETNNKLELFVLFSSVAALLGNPGQANYAAANVSLDALASHRRAHGGAAASVARRMPASSDASPPAHTAATPPSRAASTKR